MNWQNPFPETRFNLLGIPIHRLDRGQLLACFEAALNEGEGLHFAYMNVAVSNLAADSGETADLLHGADMVYVDGAGIRLGCRILGADCPRRNTGADFIGEALELCARMGKSVGFLGGSPNAARNMAALYQNQLPGLKISFIRNGYNEFHDADGLDRDLSGNPPDILLVGLGVPTQEKWIARNRERYKVRLYWSVGALFEYNGGTLRRCPSWMGDHGLEWLFRLMMEPGRLWKRYLIGNPRFLLRCLCSRWRGRAEMP